MKYRIICKGWKQLDWLFTEQDMVLLNTYFSNSFDTLTRLITAKDHIMEIDSVGCLDITYQVNDGYGWRRLL